MQVFVAGGTGFIGPHLMKVFQGAGFEVKALVRRPERVKRLPEGVKPVFGNPLIPGPWQEECARAQVVVNLVGANIFARWTEPYKRLIRESRLEATRLIVSALREGSLLLNASAVGYYGADRGEEEITEESPPGNDFLAEVCQAWEKAALRARVKDVRVCLMRFGIVLGRDGGALAKMLFPFRLGLGGPLGSGKQWFPWIHVQDVANAALFLTKKSDLSGPFNFVAPQAVRHKEFVKTLARVLRRPALFPVPVFFLRLLFGELSKLLTGGVKARPKRLLEAGYQFLFPELEPALRDLVGKSASRRSKNGMSA